MRRLFILRPQPGADESAERARALGLEPVVAPLFEVEPVAWNAPEPAGFDALLLTSANAVRCGGDNLNGLRGLQVHAIGEATAAAARDAGFGIASVGDANIERLLGSIAPNLRLLHLCGVERRLPDDVRQTITSVPVYRAEPLPEPRGLNAIGGQVAAVHSPRAGRRLAELIDLQARASVRVAAISDAAASAAGESWERVEAADAPNDDALLALAARLCEKNRE